MLILRYKQIENARGYKGGNPYKREVDYTFKGALKEPKYVKRRGYSRYKERKSSVRVVYLTSQPI